jgi:hypothetical protein
MSKALESTAAWFNVVSEQGGHVITPSIVKVHCGEALKVRSIAQCEMTRRKPRTGREEAAQAWSWWRCFTES